MKLGEFLTEYRSKNDLTMQLLADACGFSKAYLSMLEKGINPQTGKPYSPTMHTFEKIAKGTGMDVDSLFKILDDDQPITLNPSRQRLNQEEMNLVDNYRELNAEDKDFLWNVIRRLLCGYKGTPEKNLHVNNNNGNNYGLVGGNFNPSVTIG